ncbi:MAG: DUF4149 domain-containing protein [Alphaproteobacteria bacterium]|jgi:hypothetical protein|nr:DUF4149 domain-containing protein [Alphaproteobacteria bacterium]MBT4020726.1 DUF4149 domain-containing protein [Alphaproteobacteria bacterium]MBT4965174.1 DUF4149 domain-containing protein [Alphaproteobacteria bacterium]MBT5159659.1 DUF4149 domain-containing protein [Alphaproteobacteria bacterium]MBT5917608.1 DUF4149 domain-containing protein [Alphaproteobacteria bacterium]
MDGLTLHSIALTFTALLLGGMVFYAVFMTPLVFAKLERPVAAEFLREVFPVYYQVMAILAVLSALPIWYRMEAAILAGMATLFVLIKLFLLPVINRARDARDEGDAAGAARFSKLHRVSVLINLAQMMTIFWIFLRLAQ